MRALCIIELSMIIQTVSFFDQIDSNVTIYQLAIGSGKPSSPKYSIRTRLSDDSDNNLRE